MRKINLIPRCHDWHEAKGPEGGLIIHESQPVTAWLVGWWLHLPDEIVSHGRVGDLLDPFWRRRLPYWGSPICAAACRAESWLDSRYIREEARYAVPEEQLVHPSWSELD